MRARRFQAATVAEAYEQVRAALGDDAVIISTRQAVAPGMLGFGRREFVEVVAGVPDAAEADPRMPLRPLVQDAAAHELVRGLAERAAARSAGIDLALPPEPPRRSVLAAPSAEAEDDRELAPPFVNAAAGAGLPRGGPFDIAARQQDPPPPIPSDSVVPVPLDPPAAAIEPPAIDHGVLAQLTAGLQEVRTLVERMARERIDETIATGPAGLAEVRAQLIEQGLAPAVLLPLLDHVAATVTPNASADGARQAVERRLAAQLPPTVALDLTRRPVTLFMVGPSGAGKTTAAVRLGMQLGQQGPRVTIAGTDVDRAGAPQQLQALCGATGLRTRACYTPGELQAVIRDGESDVVIVDTPGHNGTRSDRMAELAAFTQAARERTVLLVLPATMQAEDLLHLTRAFAAVRPSGLLLTRCDETARFGGLVAAVQQSGIGVAYTTHDESVAAPARAGDNHALAAAVLAGGWPSSASLSQRRAG